MAAFQDSRVAPQLLDTVWMLYPSARPALVDWLGELAVDGRPLVRTRASAAAALLTRSDLSSGLAHLIEPWADSRSYAARLAAANALTLAHLLHAVAIPQILHSWCTGDDESRRWTAIRAYGLLGPVLPDDALQALITAAREHHRKEEDRKKQGEEERRSEELRELVEAIELLLLAARGPVLAELALLVEQDRAVRNPALGAFLLACDQPSSEADDRPLVLDWYRTALERTPCERGSGSPIGCRRRRRRCPSCFRASSGTHRSAGASTICCAPCVARKAAPACRSPTACWRGLPGERPVRGGLHV
jgi:hypothetical protein